MSCTSSFIKPEQTSHVFLSVFFFHQSNSIILSETAEYDLFHCQNVLYNKPNEKQSVAHCFLFT